MTNTQALPSKHHSTTLLKAGEERLIKALCELRTGLDLSPRLPS